MRSVRTLDFVRFFRASSPYIHAHRNRTFVVFFGGEAIQDNGFASLIYDCALLNSLGVRLVLVPGIRPQINTRLAEHSITPRYRDGLRITDPATLLCVKEAAGFVRVEVESLLSQGLPNTPMAGARIRVISGNFVTAKPIGVRDGVDYQHTGTVRRVDADAIHAALDRDDVVLLSAIGYSPTGEAFNLSAEEVATHTAIALNADKLLLLTEEPGITESLHGAPITQLTTDEAQQLLHSAELSEQLARHLRAGVAACRGGVTRVHLLDRKIDGVLLRELFTRDGAGTLISQAPYENLRPAALHDVSGMLELITPLEAEGVLLRRGRERLESDIDDYVVLERDGLIIGCAALHAYSNASEIACLALHPAYRGGQRGARLLATLEARARARGDQELFALTTQTAHWFLEQGFAPARLEDIPAERRALYNVARNSKIFRKSLTGPGS